MKKKCYCETDPHTECGDCGKKGFVASGQSLDDIRSALSFTVKNMKGAPVTVKAMKKILKDTWRVNG